MKTVFKKLKTRQLRIEFLYWIKAILKTDFSG